MILMLSSKEIWVPQLVASGYRYFLDGVME